MMVTAALSGALAVVARKQPTTRARKVAVLVTDWHTQIQLHRFANDAGFDLASDYDGNARDPAEFIFHLTLAASENELALPVIDTRISPVIAAPDGVEELGVDRRVPVLSCADPTGDLFALRSMVLGMGLVPTFKEFKPHVSLSYRWDGTPALEGLRAPLPVLTFDRFYIKDLS